MPAVTVVIFHQPPDADEPVLTRTLREAREALAAHQAALFERAGARVEVIAGGRDATAVGSTFGQRLARVVTRPGWRGSGLVVLGSGAVPLLRGAEASALVGVAAMSGRHALTNNRYSSDVCAISEAAALRDLPPLAADNALPRWLVEDAGYEVGEMPGRERLALDLDSPLDLALLALGRDGPASVRRVAAQAGLAVPRLDELRRVATDPRAELLVAGRAGSGTLRWLELHTRCRVRFLGEERGLRAGAALGAQGQVGAARPPRSVLGRLLDARGVDALGPTLAELADGAIIDSRVLLADRLGSDEHAWPPVEDRYASDLLRFEAVRDPWLAGLTASAAAAPTPVVLGAHTLVGPGIRRLLAGVGGRAASGESGERRALG